MSNRFSRQDRPVMYYDEFIIRPSGPKTLSPEAAKQIVDNLPVAKVAIKALIELRRVQTARQHAQEN